MVPEPTAPTQAVVSTETIPLRTRRLLAEADQMKKRFKDFGLISVTSVGGNPPDLYRIDYAVKGLEPGADGRPAPRASHTVEIQLTHDYPRVSPKCRMITPIFHPNIDSSTICIGDHWTAGEHLTDLVVRIGEMIAYQAYNIKSPLDGEAAMWADLNVSKLPIDLRNVHPPEPTKDPSATKRGP